MNMNNVNLCIKCKVGFSTYILVLIDDVPSDVTATSRFCPALCARIVFCINLGVIAFELCDLWRYSLTELMQNTMRAHSAGQISMEGGVDVNKGHMVYSIAFAHYNSVFICSLLNIHPQDPNCSKHPC